MSVVDRSSVYSDINNIDICDVTLIYDCVSRVISGVITLISSAAFDSSFESIIKAAFVTMPIGATVIVKVWVPTDVFAVVKPSHTMWLVMVIFKWKPDPTIRFVMAPYPSMISCPTPGIVRNPCPSDSIIP